MGRRGWSRYRFFSLARASPRRSRTTRNPSLRNPALRLAILLGNCGATRIRRQFLFPVLSAPLLPDGISH